MKGVVCMSKVEFIKFELNTVNSDKQQTSSIQGQLRNEGLYYLNSIVELNDYELHRLYEYIKSAYETKGQKVIEIELPETYQKIHETHDSKVKIESYCRYEAKDENMLYDYIQNWIQYNEHISVLEFDNAYQKQYEAIKRGSKSDERIQKHHEPLRIEESIGGELKVGAFIGYSIAMATPLMIEIIALLTINHYGIKNVGFIIGAIMMPITAIIIFGMMVKMLLNKRDEEIHEQYSIYQFNKHDMHTLNDIVITHNLKVYRKYELLDNMKHSEKESKPKLNKNFAYFEYHVPHGVKQVIPYNKETEFTPNEKAACDLTQNEALTDAELESQVLNHMNGLKQRIYESLDQFKETFTHIYNERLQAKTVQDVIDLSKKYESCVKKFNRFNVDRKSVV